MLRPFISISLIFFFIIQHLNAQSISFCDEEYPNFEWYLRFPCFGKNVINNEKQILKRYDYYKNDGTLEEYSIVSFKKFDEPVPADALGGIEKIEQLLKNDLQNSIKEILRIENYPLYRMIPLKPYDKEFDITDDCFYVYGNAVGYGGSHLNDIYIYAFVRYYVKFGLIDAVLHELIVTKSKNNFEEKKFASESIYGRRIKDPYILKAPLLGISFEMLKNSMEIKNLYDDQRLVIDYVGVNSDTRKKYRIDDDQITITKIKELSAAEKFSSLISQYKEDNQSVKTELNPSEWMVNPNVKNILILKHYKRYDDGTTSIYGDVFKLLFEFNNCLYEIAVNKERARYLNLTLKHILKTFKKLAPEFQIVNNLEEAHQLFSGILDALDHWSFDRFKGIKGEIVSTEGLISTADYRYKAKFGILNFPTYVTESSFSDPDKRTLISVLKIFPNEGDAKQNLHVWADLLARFTHNQFTLKLIRKKEDEYAWKIENLDKSLNPDLNKVEFGIRLVSVIYPKREEGNNINYEVQLFVRSLKGNS